MNFHKVSRNCQQRQKPSVVGIRAWTVFGSFAAVGERRVCGSCVACDDHDHDDDDDDDDGGSGDGDEYIDVDDLDDVDIDSLNCDIATILI